MDNIFDGKKRYNSFDSFFKAKFGCKVAKIPLNGGFTCPNRDGTKAFGGCIYCSESKSGEFAGNPEDSVEVQFEKIKSMMASKWKDTKYMPYFQAGTNTYASLEKLKLLYEPVLKKENVVAFSIATRPDCIESDVLDYLEDVSKRVFLTVELGLQSVFDETGDIINRRTTYAEFLDCFYRLKERNIPVCVHLINGLPNEDYGMMMHSVKTVSDLHPWAIKLHMLHILKGTVCEKMYLDGKIKVFSLDEYVKLVCDELEITDKNIVIQRLTGDGARDALIAPLWSIKKFEVLNSIDREFERRGTYQGIYAN
ncbi:MAG: TIGR01212 family radical SAM protein [Clostridia bacterium]|nr:TIGR01212 family radical SAM protein [Clostridia bacterium]